MLKLKYLIQNYELTKQILQNWYYDKDNLDECLQYYRISSNAVYPFTWNGNWYILRYAPVQEKKIQNLKAEMEFLDYLHENKFPALRVVPDKNGDKLVKTDTKWGAYYACVFSRVDGESLEDQPVNCHIMEKYGSTLGSLHKLSENCPDLQADTCQQVLTKLGEWLKEYNAPQIVLDEYQIVKKELKQMEKNSSEYGVVHFDFELDNVFYHKETDTCHVIDFEDMMYHFYAMDIAKALDSIYDEYGAENYDSYKAAFLKGYKSEHTFSDNMRNSMQLMRRFEQLYKYAGSLRSMADKMENEPDWMLEIREKLKYVNSKIEANIQGENQFHN